MTVPGGTACEATLLVPSVTRPWNGAMPSTAARWNAAFNNILLPLLGVLFLPWTTLAYVLMSHGGVQGLQWAVVIFGFLLDIGALGSGGYSNRRRHN